MGENKKSGAIDSLGIGEAVDDIAAVATRSNHRAVIKDGTVYAGSLSLHNAPRAESNAAE